MIKTTKILLLIAVAGFFFLNALNVGASGADDAFDEVDEIGRETADQEIIIRVIPAVPNTPPPPPPSTPLVKPVTPEPAAPQRPVSRKTVSSNGYDFTLEGCTLSGQNIQCNLMIVRTEKDAELWLYPNNGSRQKTSVIDTQGNQYVANSASLGASDGRRQVHLRLIKDIPTKSKLYFNDVSSETSSIAVLEIPAHDGGRRKDFNIQFRDIHLGS